MITGDFPNFKLVIVQVATAHCVQAHRQVFWCPYGTRILTKVTPAPGDGGEESWKITHW